MASLFGKQMTSVWGRLVSGRSSVTCCQSGGLGPSVEGWSRERETMPFPILFPRVSWNTCLEEKQETSKGPATSSEGNGVH